jgi:hypothetical protein
LQEIVSGKDDGETVWSGFNFDALEFLSEFEAEAGRTWAGPSKLPRPSTLPGPCVMKRRSRRAGNVILNERRKSNGRYIVSGFMVPRHRRGRRPGKVVVQYVPELLVRAQPHVV